MKVTNVLRRHAFALAVTLASVLCATFSVQLNPLLRYDRAAIAGGEIWRVVSAHITHLGWNHLGLNVAGLVLIWLLFRREMSDAQWTTTFFISACGVSLGLWLNDPNVAWYVGLSGVLHGLFVAGAIGAIQNGHRREWLLLVVMVGKLISEQIYGPSPGSEEIAGGPVIVNAHLYGALAGGAAALLFYWQRRRRVLPPNT